MTYEKLPRGRVWDKLLLVGSAIFVCFVGVSAFVLADSYKLSPAWIFFGLNSIGFVAVVGRKFSSHARSVPFVTFLVIWLIVHSAVMVALTAWFPVLYWLPLIAIELIVGYLAAYRLFGLPQNESAQS